jgi:hypothetical protein
MKKPGPRRSGGFIRAGEADLGRVGMPRRRALELRLHHGWRQIAGPELAERLRPVRVVRGCLELECTDTQWSSALSAVLPGLVRDLAEADSGLGIRKFRILGDGSDPVGINLRDGTAS